MLITERKNNSSRGARLRSSNCKTKRRASHPCENQNRKGRPPDVSSASQGWATRQPETQDPGTHSVPGAPGCAGEMRDAGIMVRPRGCDRKSGGEPPHSKRGTQDPGTYSVTGAPGVRRVERTTGNWRWRRAVPSRRRQSPCPELRPEQGRFVVSTGPR